MKGVRFKWLDSCPSIAISIHFWWALESIYVFYGLSQSDFDIFNSSLVDALQKVFEDEVLLF